MSAFDPKRTSGSQRQIGRSYGAAQLAACSSIVQRRVTAEEETRGRPRANQRRSACLLERGGRPYMGGATLHTDITLAPVTEALLAFARPQTGERVLDIGCGCGAATVEFARAVGTSGRVAALDISGPMLAEGQARANAAGIANITWRQVDPATAALDPYD